ncbi:hypothetical protein AAFC00_001030 [Neodothiora populina]
MISHLDISNMSPYIAFGLSVASSVFIDIVKIDSNHGQASSNLRYIRSTMQALQKTHPVTKSFLVQLDIAMESCDIHNDMASSNSHIPHFQGSITALSTPEISSTDQSPQSTLMAEELQHYKALPVSLNGILPQLRQQQDYSDLTLASSANGTSHTGQLELIGQSIADIDFDSDLHCNVDSEQLDDPMAFGAVDFFQDNDLQLFLEDSSSTQDSQLSGKYLDDGCS